MTFLFRGKRAVAIPSAIFFTLFFTLFSIIGSVYLAIGIGNPVNKVTGSLIASQRFKHDAGTYFVLKALETAKGDERRILTEKGPEISQTITAFLGNPTFHTQLNQITDTAYHYYTNGTKVPQSIDVRPIASLALLGLEAVDPQFSQLKKELNKIKPIDLKPQTNGPDAASIKSDLTLAVLLFLLLSLLTIFFYLLFAKDAKSAARTAAYILVGDGIFLIVINILAKAIISSQATKATESLAREAIPIVASPLLSPFLLVGFFEVIAAVILFGLTYLKGMNLKSQG
jgi:hypothetical protein